MLRTLSIFLTCFAFSVPAYGQMKSVIAFVCQPTSGPAFFAFEGPGERGPTRQVGGYEVSLQMPSDELALREAVLSDVGSSTMLIFTSEGDKLAFRGLLGGEAVAGECNEVTKEFLKAVEFSSPSLSQKLAQTEELLQQEVLAKRIVEDRLDSMRESVDSMRESVHELELANISKKEGKYQSALAFWRTKVEEANNQISQLCLELSKRGINTSDDKRYMSLCKRL